MPGNPPGIPGGIIPGTGGAGTPGGIGPTKGATGGAIGGGATGTGGGAAGLGANNEATAGNAAVIADPPGMKEATAGRALETRLPMVSKNPS